MWGFIKYKVRKIERPKCLESIERNFRVHPVCALLGSRQVGKTTLAKMFLSHQGTQNFHFFDLEDPVDLAKMENPMLTLPALTNKLLVIDEIQRAPELFPVLRVLVDDRQKGQRFLILGSASRDLLRQSSESLASRIGTLWWAFSM